MNGFEQIKGFYSWVFNNPERIRPTHISLYLFLWNQANRANWVEWFKCPYDLAMQGACIGNKGTYYRCLDDLKLFELIDYKKGINNFKAPLVHLIQLYDNEQLTEHVTVPLSEPQTVPLYVPQCEPQHVPIYKLITSNLKPITENLPEFEKFILELGNTKKPKLKKQPEALQFPFTGPEFLEAWNKLITLPKWKNKPLSAIQISLNQLSKYDEDFSVKLIEKAHAGNYQGVVFSNTDNEFLIWKQKSDIERKTTKKSIKPDKW